MRTLLKTPKAITKISPRARNIIQKSNLLLLGVHIDLNDLSPEEVAHIEYYGMRRRNIEEKARFEALIEILKKLRM